MKIWNVHNLECLLNIKNINESGNLSSSCFINYNKNIYILTSNQNIAYQEPIKIFNFKGQLISKLNSSSYSTIFIDVYYDNKTKINYIIAGCQKFVRSYNYNKNKLYYKYSDIDAKIIDTYYYHYSVIINDKKDFVKMIEIEEKGIIRIWNFHSAQLLKKIKNDDMKISSYGLCQWDDDHLFIGTKNGLKQIVFDFNKEKEISQKENKGKTLIRMKKIIHPKYGNCLITQEYNNGYSINLLITKK